MKMLNWKPISELVTNDISEDDTFIVWCPYLTVSGPAVVAFYQDREWKAAITGYTLDTSVTHYAEINSP